MEPREEATSMAGERFYGEGDFQKQKVQIFEVNFCTVSIWSETVPDSPTVKTIHQKGAGWRVSELTMIAGRFRLGLCSRSTWHFPAICPKLGYRSLSCTIDVFGVLTETNQTADWFNHRPCWMWCFFGFWRLCNHRCLKSHAVTFQTTHRGFSFGSLYIFAQALGLVWMFLVVLLAVMSVRIVLLGA